MQRTVLGSIELMSPTEMEVNLRHFAERVAASLGVCLADHFPVQSVAGLKQDVPDRWVALVPTSVDEGFEVASGYVLAISEPDEVLDDFEARVEKLPGMQPAIYPAIVFTGGRIPGEAIASA